MQVTVIAIRWQSDITDMSSRDVRTWFMVSLKRTCSPILPRVP